jgi:hypothetical protein
MSLSRKSDKEISKKARKNSTHKKGEEKISSPGSFSDH